MFKLFKQVSRFGFVGILSNLFGFIAYAVLVGAFGWSAFLAILLVSPVFILLNFVLHQHWVFKSEKLEGWRFFLYVLQYVLNYFINIFGIYVFVHTYDIDPILSQACLLFLLGIISFCYNKKLFLGLVKNNEDNIEFD